MRILTLLSIFLATASFSQDVTVNPDTLRNWFQEGVYDAKIYKVQPSSKAAQIQKTMADSIKNHLVWFREYVSGLDRNQELPYHKNLGVSEETYNEFLELKDKTEYVNRGNANLKILPDSTNTFCKFNSVGFIVAVNFLTINFEDGTINVNSNLSQKGDLKPIAEVEDDKSSNRFGSKFNGYIWKYTSDGFAAGNGTEYVIQILHLTDFDDIYMEVATTVVKNGVSSPTNHAPFQFGRLKKLMAPTNVDKKEPRKLKPRQ